MNFTKEVVEEYLSILNDRNPIHSQIVPGQLICEMVFRKLNIHWNHYKIKYLKPIDIHEDIRFFVEDETKIVVSSHLNGVKLIVFKI